MAYVCAVTGVVPEDAVVSRVSGHIYERRVLEKYLADNGTDPVTGQSMGGDDIIAVKPTKPAVRPRPPTATSIPALLKTFQDEWDAVMLESYTLKLQLETVRQQLSQTLYEHDAACRTVARLARERDQARAALANFRPIAATSGATDSAMEGVETAPQADSAPGASASLPESVVGVLTSVAGSLTKGRKDRRKEKNEARDGELTQKYRSASLQNSYPAVHSASQPGILSIAVHPNGSHILTGGVDKNAVLFDKSKGQTVGVMSGHTKKVTSVLLHPTADVAFTASQDSTVRFFSTTDFSQRAVLKEHSKEITGITLHASSQYIVSASADKSWSFSDVESARSITTVRGSSQDAGFTIPRFHPDGLILATGTTAGTVKVWDLKQLMPVATFEGHTGSIRGIAFSDNGYHLATAGEDSTVKLWDLRHLTNFHSIQLGEGYNVKSLEFDPLGLFLGVGGSDVRVYRANKTWDHLSTLNDHTGDVTGVAFAPDSSYLASVSMDRSLKIFA